MLLFLVEALVGGGLASAPATVPGRSLTLLPCTPEAEAACWEEARPLVRFAAPPGTEEAPREVDVRLAWSASGLLVHARDLPEHAVLDLSLQPAEEARSSRAAAAQVGPGLTETGLALEPGRLYDARVQLVLREGRESPAGVALPWTPTGPPQLHRSFPLLAVHELGEPLGVELADTDDGLAIFSPGARLHLEEAGPAPGPHYRGSPKPLDLSGEDALVLPHRDEPGWLALTATRAGAQGRLEALEVRLLHHTPPAPEGLVSHGVHPPPRWVAEPGGAPYRLRPGARILVASEQAAQAAAWLQGELRRTLGLELPLLDLATAAEPAGPRDILFGAPDEEGLPSDPVAAELLAGEEGFLITLDGRGARVQAGSLRGHTYGAVALSQALFAQSGQGPRALHLADAPDLPTRLLFHSPHIAGRMRLEVADYVDFLDRVVVPGRYNTLVIALNDRVQWASHPELADRLALSKEDWRALLDAARARGLEVIPGLGAPSHADWIVSHRPELREGNNPKLLCTRHPETWPLIADLYEEALQLFDQPRFVHIGHDEHRWRFEKAPAEERCPRCSGTQPAVLFAEDLRWHLDLFRQRGVTPMAWSDQLVAGHNGGLEGSHRALDLLSEEARSELVVTSWARLGDPVDTLGVERGMTVIRTHTAYLDHKRAGLSAEAEHIAGEGLGLFVPAPWSTLTFAPGTRALGYHSPSIVLAGASAWRNTLVDRGAIAPSLAALADHPAYRPGLALPAGFRGRTRPLSLQGGAGVGLPAVAWPGSLAAGGVSFRPDPVVARPGEPVTVEVSGSVRGISLLQAATVDWEAERTLREALKASKRVEGAPLAELRLRWADGETEAVPLFLGTDTERLSWDPRAVALWDSAASVALASPEAAAVDPRAADRRLYRWDWVNPSPERALAGAEVVVVQEGAQLLVGAASALVR